MSSETDKKHIIMTTLKCKIPKKIRKKEKNQNRSTNYKNILQKINMS